MSAYAQESGAGGSAYAQSGGSVGSPYAGDGGGGAAKKKTGGILGFVGHALNQAGTDLRSIPSGAVKLGADVLRAPPGGVLAAWEHPLRSAKTDPLTADVKGIGTGTLASVEHPGRDPFQTFLTALTLISGGAGLVGKGADVARVAGSTTKVGLPVDLTAPDFAVRAGQPGADVLLKRSSANPALKAAQVGTNKALNALPHQTPIVGSDARVVKALAKAPARDAARIAVAAQPSTAAFEKLNMAERAAWHLRGQGVTPVQYKALLVTQKTPASATMLKLLDDPKVAQLVEHPSPRLHAALAEGRAASEHLTAMKVAVGHVSETSAAESPYRLLRLVNGAKVEPTADGGFSYADQPGREIPALAHELAAKGWEQPFYIPHSADTGSVRGLYRNKPPAGFAAPGVSGTSKQNLGILASQGKLAFNQNPLAREYAKFKNFTQAQHLHDAIVQHAAELPDAAALPNGYEFLKINRGSASAPYTQQIGGKFEHGLDQGFSGRTFTTDAKDAEILRNAEGQRLVVPSSVRRLVESRQASVPHTALGLANAHLTSVWKHMVLGLRPAFLGNITVGNSILGLLQSAPRYGFTSWLNQVAPGLERALGSRVTAETMNEVFPEQAVGTFGHSTGFGGAAGTTKLARGASRLYQGVMPATIAYENVLRRAMVEGWAKASPEVRAAMKFPGPGLASHGDINQALRDVAKTHPHVIDAISKRVDDALGDYRNYNRLERAVKQLIPFYGWDRHIVRSTARLAKERPGTLLGLAKTGQVGEQQNNATLGPLPSYLQSAVKLPGLPGFMGPLDGRTPLLVPSTLNPFGTDAELAQIPGALTGNAGGYGSETLSSGLNPFIQALIEQATGKSLLSGAPVKGNAFANVATNLPQVGLLRAAIGGTPATKPTSLYRKDIQTMLAQFLGVPAKKANLQTAHLYAAEEGKPRR